MKAKTRYLDIDFIRAVGTIGVIVTHVLALHLGPTNINSLWNYLHFVVVGFIFCSSYVYAAANPVNVSQNSWIVNFTKRLKRLYIPFVVYLAFHYGLWIVFPSFFRGFGLQQSISFLVSSLALTGGADIGWLPLLFIQLALIAPFLLAVSRHPFIRNILLMFLGILTLITTFWRVPQEYSRVVAWIPWSFIAILSYMYSYTRKNNPASHNRAIKFIMLAGIFSWVVLYGTLSYLGQPLTFTLHKYPPDLLYFSYGISATGVLLLLYEKLEQRLSSFTNLITLISKRAYMIFFLHYIVLDAVTTLTHWSWWQESITIIFISLIIAFVWDRLEVKKLFR